MRRAKVDANQQDIMQALKRCGCSVQSLHTVGKGVPDLLVGIDGKQNLLVEVKATPTDKLNAMQTTWHKAWLGPPVYVVRTRSDVVDILRQVRRKMEDDGSIHRRK